MDNARESKYDSVVQSLADLNGLVVRQKAQKAEILAQAPEVPYEAENKYKVHLLPTDKAVQTTSYGPKGWEPTNEDLEKMDAFLFAQEKSDLFMCAGSGGVDVINRPFRIGGCCCCPLEVHLDSVVNGPVQRIGRVREDFSPYLSRCCASICMAAFYTDIDRALPGGEYEKKYSLRVNLGCCGRVNNCCAPSCCKSDAIFDILDTNGAVVANLQQAYARDRSCIGACCRSEYNFNNYILGFPPGTTVNSCMLLLTALFQIEYQLFETKEK
uniref:Phospholipid scramblase n=1 Tax=Globisporangium ultimum (strain ATCC 200006 / CBS 805.95 / DAOM BR144) TaxID=431595 RepID=K3WVW7_GLOUD